LLQILQLNDVIRMIINFYPYLSLTFGYQSISRDLSHNELISIERGSFESLTKLERLKLDHNQITYVSDGAFNYTTNLRILYVNIYMF